MPWLRSVRLDVFSIDQKGVIYNTEMQEERRTDLVKRSRYYQGLIDSSILEPGCISFNKLNDTYVIMIMPFDLFGLGKYQYTFRTYCEEEKTLELRDGVVRIFLNTKGKNDSEVSEELGVKYMQKWEEKIIEREKGRLEGKTDVIIKFLREKGEVNESLCKTIREQDNENVIDEWLKSAVLINSIQEFIDVINK